MEAVSMVKLKLVYRFPKKAEPSRNVYFIKRGCKIVSVNQEKG